MTQQGSAHPATIPKGSLSLPAAAVLILLVLPLAFVSDVIPRFQAGLRSRSAQPTFLIGDGRFYRATAMSLLYDQDLDLRNQFAQLGYRPDANTALGSRGEWYPKHSIALPVVSLPFFAMAGDVGLLLFNLVQLVILGLVMWRCAARHCTDMTAAFVTIVYCLGTMLARAAYNYSPDVLAALVFLCGYLAAVERRPVASGALVGLSVWAKLPNVFLLPVVAIYVAATSPKREAVRFAVAAAVPLIGWAGWCQWMFGSPLITPYDHVIAAIVNGQAVIEPSHRTLYDQPLLTGLLRQIFDGDRGLLVSAPIIVLAPFGLRALFASSRAEALLVAGLCAAQLLSFAKYRLWDQSSFGHRFLILTVVLTAIPVARWAGEMSGSPRRQAAGRCTVSPRS